GRPEGGGKRKDRWCRAATTPSWLDRLTMKARGLGEGIDGRCIPFPRRGEGADGRVRALATTSLDLCLVFVQRQLRLVVSPGVGIELVADGPDRDAENIRRMRPVAAGVFQGREDQVTLGFGR